MARRDTFHDNKVVVAIAPAVATAAASGSTVDTQGYSSVLFAIATGAIVGDGDFGVKIQHSDTTDNGDFTDAPATTVLGAVPATLEASTAYRLGYIGGKRYARVALTKAGGTSIAIGAVAVLGEPAIAPVA